MNNVAFFEIQADDPKRAIAFYEAVFGWNFVKQEGMPIDYWQIEGAGINGGLLPRPAAAPAQGTGTNAFTCSIQVESFDEAGGKVLENDGMIAMDKFAVPGKCWQGYFQDTEGNVLGLFQVDENAA
jgi:predicted enzyme related to lactoylglutathione lyase